MRRLLLLLACGTAACFPTFQSARIDPGPRVDVGVTYLGDQRRNDARQRPDYIYYLSPAFGGRAIEVGIPIGFFYENGLADQHLVLMPYLKVAMLSPGSRSHLALVMQTSLIAPANFGLYFGRDMGKWEPQAGLSVILSGGPAGDDPFITRYQEAGQSLLAFSLGATWNTRGRPGFDIGVLRNHYREGAVYGDFGQPTTPRTLYDLFVRARVGVF